MRRVELLYFVCLLATSICAQDSYPVYRLNYGQLPIQLSPGVNSTTGFSDDLIGSQFYIWVPQNVARIKITYEVYASWATQGSIQGKWGSFPCNMWDYYPANVWCSNQAGIGTAALVLNTNLNAYDSKSQSYWNTGDNDFIIGDYLYLQAQLNFGPCTDCYGTVNVDFDYCGIGTIATEGTNDTQCIPYTNVTTTSSYYNVTTNSPYEKVWVVKVPANSSGVRATITADSAYPNFFYMFGRYSSGGTSNNYYGNKIVQGFGNQTSFWPNLPAGDFVITVSNSLSASNLQFGLQINVFTCPDGYVSDDYGNCTFPLTITTMAALAANPGTVIVPKSGKTGNCSWNVYGFHIPAFTLGFFNLTVANLTQGIGMVYIRKNAWPTTIIYDATTNYESSSNMTWTWTSDDMYIPNGNWYYIGFCNRASNQTTSFTVSAFYGVPSPTPSPTPTSSVTPTNSPSSSVTPSMVPSVSSTPSPSFGFTPSPSSSPVADSSGPAVILSLMLLLAALVTVW